jgi:MFS family permease
MNPFKESVKSLTIKPFLIHLSSRFIITIAYQMQAVAISWWIYEITKNALYLGLIGLTEALPALSISLFAGHWADIGSRKKIILGGMMCISILNLVALLASFYLDSSSYYLLPTLFGIIFFTGLARGIMGPSNFAFISQLVEKEYLPNAATWNSFSWQFSMVLGPMLAAVFLGLAGNTSVQIIISILSLLSVVLYWNVKTRFKQTFNTKTESIGVSLKAGITYVFQHPILLGALTLDMFAVLFGGVTAILPAYTQEIFKAGPDVLGYLRSSPALGSIITMLFLAGNPPIKNTGKILFISVFMFGVFTLLFALTNHLFAACIFLFLTGAFDAISVVIRGTILQLYTPENMRGRVSSVNTIFIGSSNELGAFESGLAAKIMGIIPSVLFGGCVTIFVVIASALKFRELYRLNLLNDKGG